MKIPALRLLRSSNRCFRIICAACFIQLATGVQAAVTFTNLHSFQVFLDGADPGELVQGSDGNLYGTTSGGGVNGLGTVFKIDATGVLTRLHSFTGGNDGAGPYGGLVEGNDGSFYGMAGGGVNGVGVVFKVSTPGAMTILYSFGMPHDGGQPRGGLVLGGDGNFYGISFNGTNGGGGLFKLSAGGALTSLFSFNDVNAGRSPNALVWGSDGNLYGTTESTSVASGGSTLFRVIAGGPPTILHTFTGVLKVSPNSGLVQGSDGNFYGTTYFGGVNDEGTVFRIGIDGALLGLYSFTGGADGGRPRSGLAQGRDGNFYGTTSAGGANGLGTVFKIGAAGGLTRLYSFTGGADGKNPETILEAGIDGNLYGIARRGGSDGHGAVLKITTNGVLTVVHSFLGFNDGANPDLAGLVQASDGRFYGTTYSGGTNNLGTVFRFSSDGTLTSLYSFTGAADGRFPNGGLEAGSDGAMYGTTFSGGAFGGGIVFKIDTNGLFSTVRSFNGFDDGWNPLSALELGSNGDFYGTAPGGGLSGVGTVFKMTASGVATLLYSFAGGQDGSYPQAGLVRASDGNFYGTTTYAGLYNAGTLFRITSMGALTTLYSFDSVSDGGSPYAGLVEGSNGVFYGTTRSLDRGFGSVFKFNVNGVRTLVHSFTGGSDGANPYAGLVLGNDGSFYGTTSFGTVFRVSPSGEFARIYTFGGSNKGWASRARLAQGADGAFYGTTHRGGRGNAGTVFRLRYVAEAQAFEEVSINDGMLHLTWSATAGASYQVQFTLDPASGNWTNLGGIVTASGSTLTATDADTTGLQRYYRVVLLP